MGGEKGGSKSSGFFHLFDWNRKSRKKLFSNSPEGTKQGKRSNDTLPMTHLHLIDDDDIFGIPSVKGSSEYSCASSVTDEEGNGTRAPGVVARLMGLDSMPTTVVPEPYSTPFFDARSLRDSHNQRSPDFYANEKFNHVSHKAEDYFRKPIEARSQKMPSSPIERFQREILPPRLGKALPLSHHKLLSPIKNPSFTSAKNATQVMEAATKIIEPGLQIHPSTKGRIGSPSIPLRLRDPKDSIAASERTARLLQLSRTPVELADVEYSGGQPLNRNWNRTEDIVIVRSSPDPYESNAAGARAKGKSISLAIQAKVNVQKRESLSSSSRSTFVQKEHEEYKVNQPFSSQGNSQKNKPPKKPSQANVSGVLRQNNQKQNCQSVKGKLGSKQSTQQNGRKVLNGDPSSVKNKNVNKLSRTSRVGCRKITGLDMEGSSSSNKDFPQKKRLIEGSFNLQKSSPIYSGLVNRPEAHTKSDIVLDEHTRRSADSKNATDIVSFTFTSPLIKSYDGSHPCNLVTDKWEKGNGCNFENNFSNVSRRIPPSVGSTVLSGDSLSHLLEEKLRQLRSAIEPSCEFAGPTKLAASSSHIPLDTKCDSNGSSTLTAEQEFLPRPYYERPSRIFGSGISSINGQMSGMKNMLLAKEEVESTQSSNACLDPNYNHHSPLSVFDASFSSESWQLSECSGSKYGSNLCPSSVNAQNIVDLSSSRKSVEAEPELSDSASSVAKVPLEEIENNIMKENEHEHELRYVRKILLNNGLMSKDLGSYYLTSLAKTFDGTLFSNVHEASRNWYTKEDVNIDKGMSKLLLNCVQECLELKHDHYFKAGYRAWVKGTSKVTRKDLAHEVYDEISGWKKMSNRMVDELVDNDMSTHLGGWVDFEIETFETGKQIQRQILSTLIDEILDDFRIK